MNRANGAAIKAECTLVWNTLRAYEPPARAGGSQAMKAIPKALAAFLLGCCLLPPCAAAPDGLGRLFYTASRPGRDGSQALRPAPPQEVAARALASVLRIDGIALRPQGKTTVWINGTPYLERDLPYGMRVRRDPQAAPWAWKCRCRMERSSARRLARPSCGRSASAAAAASAPAGAGAVKPEAAR
jgi:hypothetical protein